MQSKPFEFRFRFFIHIAILVIGFTAPWNYWRAVDTKRDVWSWLIDLSTRQHWLRFDVASILFLAIGIFISLVVALLRTWSSAYMNASIVKDAAMHGSHIVAAGPYRYLRNPLYLCLFLHIFALALLMPPSGAIVAIVAITIFELRLTQLEERFLAATVGQPYLDYKARVPRFVPALTPKLPQSDAKPGWPMAFLGELYFWGVFLTFAVLGWRYNAELLTKGVIVAFGASLIVRAVVPKPGASSSAEA